MTGRCSLRGGFFVFHPCSDRALFHHDAKELDMICEACKTEKSVGDTYIVRYGTMTTTNDARKIVVTRTYAGEEDVWICDNCLDRFYGRFSLIFGISFIALFAIISLISLIQGKPEGISTLLVLGVIGGLFFYLTIRVPKKKGKKRLIKGDQYAIRLIHPRLKKQGYTGFFTRTGY
jgi:hypothetical protein